MYNRINDENININNIDPNVLRAVYALNMCTVSVSQIIDYNDIYILEQEYDAILNNLNLEKMPKANALKNILIELLNTITFFRIQEIKKEAIEKKYQKRVKNAIWSSIPNLNMIVAGGPAAIAYSIATQVGIGYMNYRKEKNSAFDEKEKEEMELRITAIEQFNALRRELFTTAWELAEEYEFDDRLRLTEKQIKQYNQILTDTDEVRKYWRLEAIKDKFEAFPPFWYHFGHTACYISGNVELPLDDWERERYKNYAKEHFTHYDELNKFNILREDQMTSAFALEYADLLLLEENPDFERITELITIAEKMSGTAWDIKQLCAISYLKVGKTDLAAKLLKQLVNEEYNEITNAKILSRIYVSQYLEGKSATARLDYKELQLRIGIDNSSYLFPMPKEKINDNKLQTEYMVELKTLLITDYTTAINQLLKKYTIKFNKFIPAPIEIVDEEEYFGFSQRMMEKRKDDIKEVLENNEKKEKYLRNLSGIDFRFRYIDLLNEILDAYDDLLLWKNSANHDLYIKYVRGQISQKKELMKKIQEHIKSKAFVLEDYEAMQEELSVRSILGKMYDQMRDTMVGAINCMKDMREIEHAEYDLVSFCQKHKIEIAETHSKPGKCLEMNSYLDYSLLGIEGKEHKYNEALLKKKADYLKSECRSLVIGKMNEVEILYQGEDKFELYFKNHMLKSNTLKEKTICIIDDLSKKDCDMLLGYDQFVLVKNNQRDSEHYYKNVEYYKSDRFGTRLVIGVYEYNNKNIDLGKLKEIMDRLIDDDCWTTRG